MVREAGIFDGCAVVVAPLLCRHMSAARRRLLLSRVAACGGAALERWEARVTHIVVSRQVADSLVLAEFGVSPSAIVVTDGWLCDSLARGCRLPEDAYRWRRQAPIGGAVKMEPESPEKHRAPDSHSRAADSLAHAAPAVEGSSAESAKKRRCFEPLLDEQRALIAGEFRTCADALVARGEVWPAWQYRKAEKLVLRARDCDFESAGLTSKFAQKSVEILRRGHLEYATDLRVDRETQALLEFTSLHGVGPKLARNWLELGVRRLDDVRTRKDSLPSTAGGLHSGLSPIQRAALRFVDDFKESVPNAEAERIIVLVRSCAKSLGIDGPVIPCGGYYQKDVPCKAVTVVVSVGSSNVESASRRLLCELMDHDVIVADLTNGGFGPWSAPPQCLPSDGAPPCQVNMCVARGIPSEGEKMIHRRVDLVICTDEGLPFVTLQWTGSEHGLFQRELRRIAAFRGFHLATTFLCRAEREGAGSGSVGKVLRVGPRIQCVDEEAIFAALKLPFQPKEHREIDVDLLAVVDEASREISACKEEVKAELDSCRGCAKVEPSESLAAAVPCY
eukprot:TRINITY_DN30113_c0_g1_i1.p1 TRINITY_DN30113_c0_g1~~TRINITY_DN30113_c0_g1_i1.p1  ORF type:complete len:562 (+),score=82.58 TRINITY_DN30113_c0_g1_i1:64-1749(+)